MSETDDILLQKCLATLFIGIWGMVASEWFSELLYNLAVRVILWKSGGNDEIPYVQAFMLLHQDEKKSDSCYLMVQGSEKKPKRKSVLQEDKEGNDSEDILLQTLNPPLAMLAVPASALTTLMQLMSFPSIASCFYTPAPDTEVREVVRLTPRSYRINRKILCWFLGHSDMVWYRHLRPNWALSLDPEPLPGQGNFPLSCREPQWEWPANWVFEDAQSIFNLRFV